MNSGIVLINKPQGWTSFDVVNKIKHIVRPQKVGHLGTLDPMATGVLLVTIGKATKLFDLMQEKVKTYQAEFEFGYETDSLDSTGKIEKRSGKTIFSDSEIKNALKPLVGEVDQVPPKFSAKSLNGVRAYEMARKNIDFDIPAKKVKIFKIDLLKNEKNKINLEIECGSGTYIRAIGRDLANRLDSCATMTKLTRTKVGNVLLEDCQNVQDLTVENIKILPIEHFLDFKTLDVSDQECMRLLNGQTLNLELENGNYFLKQFDKVVAIVKIDDFLAKMFIFLG